MNSENTHEKNKDFKYLRFPIGSSYKSPFDMKSKAGVVRYFRVFFDFVEKAVSKGENVLIHCLAGAHRAGTTGCAWLIHANNLSVDDAIKLAKSKREIIDPIANFPELLRVLRIGLDEKGLLA